MMAAARPPQLEPERFDEPTHINEGHVRNIASGKPREKAPRIHGFTLPPRADADSNPDLDGVPNEGLSPVAPVLYLCRRPPLRRARAPQLRSQLG